MNNWATYQYTISEGETLAEAGKFLLPKYPLQNTYKN